jgi:hypothetical protein
MHRAYEPKQKEWRVYCRANFISPVWSVTLFSPLFYKEFFANQCFKDGELVYENKLI